MFDTRSNIVRTMPSVKKEWIQIRVAGDIKADFVKVAELHGLTYSALLHSMIVKAIREEKQTAPEAFKTDAVTPTRSRKLPHMGKVNETKVRNKRTA